MNFLRRKSLKCKTCDEKVGRKSAWKVIMNTADGDHSVYVCPTCAKDLEKMKEDYGRP